MAKLSVTAIKKSAGAKVEIKSVNAKNQVKWRFKDKDAHKAYGIRTYSASASETASEVGANIKAQANRM